MFDNYFQTTNTISYHLFPFFNDDVQFFLAIEFMYVYNAFALIITSSYLSTAQIVIYHSKRFK